jgi:hypothetical protein
MIVAIIIFSFIRLLTAACPLTNKQVEAGMAVKDEEVCLMEECLTMKKWKENSDVIRRSWLWIIDKDKKRNEWENGAIERQKEMNDTIQEVKEKGERMKEWQDTTDVGFKKTYELIFDALAEITDLIHYNPSDEWMEKWREWVGAYGR